MRSTFRAMLHDSPRAAWWTVLGELAPTLCREWHDDLRARATTWLTHGGPAQTARAILAILPPALALAAFLARLPAWPDRAIIAFWAASAAVALAQHRGRGWRAVLRGVTFAVAAAALTILADSARTQSPPPPLQAAAAFLGLVGAVAFVLGNYVRLVVEGITIGRRRLLTTGA
jgi:hypothetical protein